MGGLRCWYWFFILFFMLIKIKTLLQKVNSFNSYLMLQSRSLTQVSGFVFAVSSNFVFLLQLLKFYKQVHCLNFCYWKIVWFACKVWSFSHFLCLLNVSGILIVVNFDRYSFSCLSIFFLVLLCMCIDVKWIALLCWFIVKIIFFLKSLFCNFRILVGWDIVYLLIDLCKCYLISVFISLLGKKLRFRIVLLNWKLSAQVGFISPFSFVVLLIYRFRVSY